MPAHLVTFPDGGDARISSYEYDAVAAIGLMFCTLWPYGPIPNVVNMEKGYFPTADWGELFYAARANLSFEGASGNVSFDESGNRPASSANLELLNLLVNASTCAHPQHTIIMCRNHHVMFPSLRPAWR